MATSVDRILLGIAVLQFLLLCSYGNHLSQSAANLFEEISQHVYCSGGSCDVGRTEPVVSSMPVHQEQMSYQPDSSLNQEENIRSPYLDFCLEFLTMRDAIAKESEAKELEAKVLSYFKTVLANYEQSPERINEIMIQTLQEIIEVMKKLKDYFEKEKSKQVPIQPTPETHVKPPAKPCVKKPPVEPTEEIIAEVISPPFVGSVRGIPGIHYPNYSEVPITSFSCGDKKYIPGFYADVETRCQVFHVCYAHRRESFLCPIGTTFNQPILACDYWYSSNCSLSSHYYDVNAKKHEEVNVPDTADVKDIITTIIEQEKPALPALKVKSKETELAQIVKFLPVKTKILEFTKPILKKPVAYVDPKLAKIAAAAVPFLKVAAAKKSVAGAVVAKKSIAGAALAKKKIVAIPVVKAGIAKTKIAAAAIPVAKATVLKPKIVAAKVAAAVPVIKAKAAVPLAKAAIPLVKAAVLKAPILKTKAAVISPLTKKALALGYVKLLKAKKLALMG